MDSLCEAAELGVCHRVSVPLFSAIHQDVRNEEDCITFSLHEQSDDPIQELINLSLACLHVNNDTFPGPMCCPFRKFHVDHVKSHAYTVMEKSDGVRVLVTGYCATHFPSWRQTDSKEVLTSSLALISALEEGRRRLNVGETVSISTKQSPLTMTQISQNAYQVSDNQTTTCCTREYEPYLMLYGVDRTASNAFLLDFVVPAVGIKSFVADAELLPPTEEIPTPMLAFFDLYSCQSDSEILTSERNTLRRHHILKILVDKLKKQKTLREDGNIRLYAKEIWKLSELDKLLAKISYNPVTKARAHEGPFGKTPNDGLVFTPEEFECVGGSRWDQLKWKWRECLTIDCKLYQSSDEGKYNVLLYLKKKCFPFKEDIVGHWRVWKPMEFQNPHNINIPSTEKDAVVVEARYNHDLQIWSLERLRQDKKEANFIGTVISVFESVAEDCSLAYLIQELLPTSSFSSSQLEEQKNPVEKPLRHDFKIRKFALLTLRAKNAGNSHKLFLTWCTNNTNADHEKIIHVPLCQVSECSALGFPHPKDGPNDVLQQLLMIEVANAGGTYAWSDFLVEAQFDKQLGHWMILKMRPNGKNYMCSFDNVLGHLGTVIAVQQTDLCIPSAKLTLSRPIISEPQTVLTNDHYGHKVEALQGEGKRSSIREFNNLIKAFQIQWGVEIVKKTLGIGCPRAADLCCGRGGDLLKWSHSSLSFLLMTDSSLPCVAAAAARYSTGKGMSLLCRAGKGFSARFVVHDAFDVKGKSLLNDLLLTSAKSGPFHIASCQFSIHYGCQTESHLDYFLSCVAVALVSGGIFIGTTMSDKALLEVYKQNGADYQSESLTIHFPSESIDKLNACLANNDEAFGIQYYATFENCVSSLPEFIVPWNKFTELCEKHQLMLVNCQTFQEFEENYAEELTALIRNGFSFSGLSGKKRDAIGNLRSFTMKNSMATKLYMAFAFKKK